MERVILDFFKWLTPGLAILLRFGRILKNPWLYIVRKINSLGQIIMEIDILKECRVSDIEVLTLM